MQLDKTRVAIRERSLPEIMDLALRVTRGHLGPLVAAWILGALPCALLNAWLLAGRFPAILEDEVPSGWLWHLGLLMIWEIPLASAPITLYLGQALFVERPSRRELLRQYLSRLPQLVWYQIVLRGGLLLLFGVSEDPFVSMIDVVVCFEWLILVIFWPYLNEVLLLERCPYLSRGGRASTWSRTRAMHAQSTASLFLRWIAALLIAALLVFAGFMAMNWLRKTLTFDAQWDEWTYQLLLPLAGWIVIGYFATVRFLSYLDLRIRTEGWEIELLLRAEGERLARQVA